LANQRGATKLLEEAESQARKKWGVPLLNLSQNVSIDDIGIRGYFVRSAGRIALNGIFKRLRMHIAVFFIFFNPNPVLLVNMPTPPLLQV
jgi:hypothetical protein